MRVKCSLTLSTCLSNELALQQNVRQDRKFQAQRDLQVAVLVQDASMRGAVVNVLGGRRSQQAHDHLPQAVGLTTCRATE